jgi:hypothetical protein
MTEKISLLADFYDPGLKDSNGEADPLNPPYFRVSRELMGMSIHTLRRKYISDDDDRKMSKEFEEYLKDVMAPLETAVEVSKRHTTNLSRPPGSSKQPLSAKLM